jgi:MerR family transcriptional regulator, light-induced transcriptional regulator
MKECTMEDALLSIGALARLSGIPVETLRNWERRYGFPQPARLDSGHRRYAWHVAARLKQIKQVLDLGYRPSFAVVADEGNLGEILAGRAAAPPDAGAEADGAEGYSACAAQVDGWLACTGAFDAAGLELSVRSAWTHCGADEFITHLAVPFLRAVGARWEDGTYTVAHEHFASGVLETFLGQQWRPLAQTARGPKVVLANLEGEHHTLGLHMAAVFLAIAGFKILFLGPSTPRRDIVAAASLSGCLAAIIGSSSAADPAHLADELAALRAELAAPIIVLVGGARATPRVQGVVAMESLDAFHDWVDTLAAASGGR